MTLEKLRKAVSLAGSTVALAAVVFAGAQVGIALIVQKSYRDFAARTRDLEAYAATAALAEHFSTVYDHADMVSGYSFPEYFKGRRSAESMRRLLDETRSRIPGGAAIIYLDELGRPLIESVAEGERARRDAIAAGYAEAYSAALAGGPSARVFGSVGPSFDCWYPVRDGGRLAGLLCISIDESPFVSEYVAPFEARKGHEILLAGSDGLVLWSSDPLAMGRTFAPPKDVAFSERSLSFGDYGLRVIVADDRASIMSMLDSREMSRTILIALIASLMAAAASLGVKLIKSESRRRVLDEAKRRLSDAVRSRDFELVESEIRFRAVFEKASDAIFILSEDGLFIRCNERVKAVLGYEPRELLGKSPVVISPEVQPDGTSSSELAARTMRRALGNPSETISFLWRGQTKGGEERDFEIDLSAIETGGVHYAQAILRDVTEKRAQMRDLREALEHREILLHELHHRVKNNLQFVISLLELQRGFEPEEARRALRRAQGRVASLAEAYLAAAEVPETLIVEAPAFLSSVIRIAHGEAASAGVRLDPSIACDELRLSLDAAVSIGLILRELSENVARHAYAGGAGGPLEVALSRDGDSGARLTVRDRGRGACGDWKEGLGLALVRGLAAQIDGELAISDAKPGVIAMVSFPLT